LQTIQQNCRLCAGPCADTFGLTILRKHSVRYYRCESCGCLQTEDPTWLDEAYESSLSRLDTGAAQRNLRNLATCYFLARLFGFANVVDIGGGDGLLCRLLRDYGLNCFVQDKYAAPSYAQGFTEPDFASPDMALAFEVLEHLVNPVQALEDVFSQAPRLILATTDLYRNQGDDWDYLAPETGQHIFFFTQTALKQVAAKYGYTLVLHRGFIMLFKQKPGALKLAVAKFLLKRSVSKLLLAALAFKKTRGTGKDHLALKTGDLTR
jgi:hypothetical protein